MDLDFRVTGDGFFPLGFEGGVLLFFGCFGTLDSGKEVTSLACAAGGGVSG